jgi:hypothetical protein
MTVKKITKLIEDCGDELDARVARLASISDQPMLGVSKIASDPNVTSLLMAAVSDQLSNAATRLHASSEWSRPRASVGPVIDLSNYTGDSDA